MTAAGPNEFDRDAAEGADAALRRLRAWRPRRRSAVALAEAMAPLAADLRRSRRRLGSVGGAWSAACPPELAERATVAGLARGVLTIACDDAATRYRLDRWLRAGGEAALTRASAAPIRRVRILARG